jgi:hydrogenase expression/formation protein HypE
MNNRKACATGACPSIKEKKAAVVTLSEGGGGQEMAKLIAKIRSFFSVRSNWKNMYDDSASLLFKQGQLVFTADSYVITPIFFPGGNIGKIAFCGTVNDLSVMGAEPLGISLSLILEDGFCKKNLFKIIKTIAELSWEYNIPIVTGDTKVMEKGAVDGIVINTSGVGRADKLLDKQLESGDHIIVSGGIGEHGSTLLAKRFEMRTELKTDSKPLFREISENQKYIKQAKDITRGGLAAVLNELAEKNKKQFFIEEQKIPLKKEVRALTEILGIEPYSLACEGRFVCVCPKEKSDKVVNNLKKFNPLAEIIGKVKQGKGVVVQTIFGKKILSMPVGNIVPRIC